MLRDSTGSKSESAPEALPLTHWRTWLFPVVLTLCLAAIIYSSNLLLFHTLAELFAICVATITFVVAWYTHGFSRNYYLLYVGVGYFWIAVLDTLHTLAYEGMPMLETASGNKSTQFWIVTRYLEALLILTAPLFLQRKFRRANLFGIFGSITATAIAAVMLDYFPTTYIDGVGLTPFKIVSEYVIIAILTAGIVHLHVHRTLTAPRIYHLMVMSIVLTMAAEMAFTFYVGLFDLSNLAGHVFKLASYWLIFLAIIRTTLTEPFSVMARNASSFDAVPDPITIVNGNGVIQQANAAACRDTNCSVEDLLGTSVHKQFHPEEFRFIDCPLCIAIRQGAPVADLRYHSPTADRWWTYALSPMREPGGELLMVHMRRDTTRATRARESARVLDTAISQVQLSVVITDAQHVIEYVNPAFEATTGYTRNEAVGKTYDFLRSDQTSPIVYRRMLERLESQRPWRGELQKKRKNGDLYWEEVSISPVIDENGDTEHYISINEDITKRRHTEDLILRLGRMVDDSLNEIFVFDADTLKIVQVNRGLSLNLGYSRDELIQMTPCDFIEGMDENALRRQLAPLSESDDSQVFLDTMHQRKDGSPLAVSLRIRRIATETPPVYLAVGEDVTEKLRFEEALRQASKMEGIGRLTGGIAHDFNNLLGIIIGNLDMLEDDLEKAEEEKLPELAAAQRAAQRGADLTRRLLAFSRNSPKTEATVSPSAIIQEMVPMLNRLTSDRVQLVLPQGPVQSRSRLDPGDFEDALLNLCVNAVDAMPNGGTLTIDVSEDTVRVGSTQYAEGIHPGPYIIVTIADTGTGIPDTIRDRIFEPFFTTKPRDRGTGLGLSMVYGFAHRSGGHVTLNDNPGGGTVFHIYLPRATAVPKTKADKTAETTEKTRHGGTETILVVDDEPELLTIAERNLSGLGYRVLSAESPGDALAILNHPDAKVDLLFTDIVMPGEMSGLDLAEAAVTANPSLRCLITTGHAGYRDESGKWETAWPVLMKPYSRETLDKAVRSVMEGQSAPSL